MSSVTGIERRMVLQIIAHWDTLRQERRFPTPEELDPAVPPLKDFWQDCFMALVAEPADRCTFEFVGANVLQHSHLADDWHRQAARTFGDSPDGTLLSHAVSYAGQVLAKSVPISRGDSYTEGDLLVRYRSILLPMSSDGTRVDRLFGAVNCMRVDASLTATAQRT